MTASLSVTGSWTYKKSLARAKARLEAIKKASGED